MQLQKLFTLSGLALLTGFVGGTASGEGGAAVAAPATSSASPIHSSVTTSPMTSATSTRHTSTSHTHTTLATITSRPHTTTSHTTTPHTTASQSPTTPAAPIFTGAAGVADAGRNALEILGVVVVAAALV